MQIVEIVLLFIVFIFLRLFYLGRKKGIIQPITARNIYDFIYLVVPVRILLLVAYIVIASLFMNLRQDTTQISYVAVGVFSGLSALALTLAQTLKDFDSLHISRKRGPKTAEDFELLEFNDLRHQMLLAGIAFFKATK